MKKILKPVLQLLLLVLIAIQFFRPERNLSCDESKHISKVFPVSTEINSILQNSCNDCHSNKTVYPWYTNIQPIGWWLAGHVADGKDELNFSDFAASNLKRKYHKMEEIIKQVKADAMPLSSYTLMHRNAELNAEQKSALINWATSIIDTLKVHYPLDSLVRKKD